MTKSQADRLLLSLQRRLNAGARLSLEAGRLLVAVVDRWALNLTWPAQAEWAATLGMSEAAFRAARNELGAAGLVHWDDAPRGTKPRSYIVHEDALDAFIRTGDIVVVRFSNPEGSEIGTPSGSVFEPLEGQKSNPSRARVNSSSSSPTSSADPSPRLQSALNILRREGHIRFPPMLWGELQAWIAAGMTDADLRAAVRVTCAQGKSSWSYISAVLEGERDRRASEDADGLIRIPHGRAE